MRAAPHKDTGVRFSVDYREHIQREMDMNRFDYVRGFLTAILACLLQKTTPSISGSGSVRTLTSVEEFDRFLDELNHDYGATKNVRFARDGDSVQVMQAGQEVELLKFITDAIVDEAHPEAVILFGSRARKTNAPDSDVDLLVVLSDSEEARRRRQITGRLYRRLRGICVPVELLVYTRSEVERWRDTPGHIIATCLTQGIPLYGRA
ncbi:MAG: nucleotidyltransferase domain-containing protein [Candidatus Hydrogenedentota bacterium]